jgi:hypothetical protein
MTEKEYFKKIDELSRISKKEKEKVDIQYAESNRKYNIGDIVEGSAGVMIIEKIGYMGQFFKTLPQCTYIGPKLRKSDLQPVKKGDRYLRVSQCSITKLYEKESNNANR